VQYIQQKCPSVDATLLCVSYAEAKLGRLFFKPITVPGRIWLSLKGAKLWKQMKNIQANGVAINSKKNLAMKSSFIGAKSNAVFSREFHHMRVTSRK
jgi:hypothetical protein